MFPLESAVSGLVTKVFAIVTPATLLNGLIGEAAAPVVAPVSRTPGVHENRINGMSSAVGAQGAFGTVIFMAEGRSSIHDWAAPTLTTRRAFPGDRKLWKNRTAVLSPFAALKVNYAKHLQ